MRQRLTVAVVALGALAAHAATFLPYLPLSNGMGGPDYGLFLPRLLAGYFWFERNGLFSIPWFTPAFCGGLPYFPNPQNMYLSVPQFLTFGIGPVRAIQLTFLAFAAAGFAGFYVLLRRIFAVSRWVALAGGVLFLFNGFFAYRLIIGHLTFHAFMLVPVVAACVLASERADGARRLFDAWVLLGGLLLAYMVQSGMVHALPPSLAGVVVIILVHALMFGCRPTPLLRLGIAGGIGLALSAAKLAAALAYVEHVPRDMMPLIGFGSLWQAAAIAVLSLFVAPAAGIGAAWFAKENSLIVLHRHEFEYGVTYLPAVIIGIWLAYKAVGVIRGRDGIRLSLVSFALVGVVAALLSLPLLLNWYEPGWNALLKQLPFFRSSLTLVRWFCMYVLVTVLLTALIVDRTKLGRRFRAPIALVIVGTVVLLNAVTHRAYYEQAATYDLHPVNQSFLAIANGAAVPAVSRIDGLGASSRHDLLSRWDRNNNLIRGGSQAECYEPMFGYGLEEFPRGPLHEGPALEARDGLLNMKDPACYVYPEQNACEPGDHFEADEIEAAAAFADYRPFPFQMPWWQRAANLVSLVTLVLVLGSVGFCAAGSVRAAALRRAPPARSRPGLGTVRAKERGGRP